MQCSHLGACTCTCKICMWRGMNISIHTCVPKVSSVSYRLHIERWLERGSEILWENVSMCTCRFEALRVTSNVGWSTDKVYRLWFKQKEICVHMHPHPFNPVLQNSHSLARIEAISSEWLRHHVCWTVQVYYLRALNEVERQRWVTALELAKAKAIKNLESGESVFVCDMLIYTNAVFVYR